MSPMAAFLALIIFIVPGLLAVQDDDESKNPGCKTGLSSIMKCLHFRKGGSKSDVQQIKQEAAPELLQHENTETSETSEPRSRSVAESSSASSSKRKSNPKNWIVVFLDGDDHLCTAPIAEVQGEPMLIMPLGCSSKIKTRARRADVRAITQEEAVDLRWQRIDLGHGLDGYSLNTPLKHSIPIQLSNEEMVLGKTGIAVDYTGGKLVSTPVIVTDSEDCGMVPDNNNIYWCAKEAKGEEFKAADGSPIYIEKEDGTLELVGVRESEHDSPPSLSNHVYVTVNDIQVRKVNMRR